MFEVIELGGFKSTKTQQKCNHVYVVDVSGSMYGDISKVREHLKNSFTMNTNIGDTISVIWFSGRGQCGTVFTNVEITENAALTSTSVNTAIDRFIKCIGSTGFVDPIKMAGSLDLPAGNLNHFIMMTDGYDNNWSSAEIDQSLKSLIGKYDQCTFIEYGYYADRATIARMASIVGGTHLFAEGYTQYETIVNESLANTQRTQNISVKVNKAAKECVYVYNNAIRIVDVVDSHVSVPEDVERIHSIVPKDVLSKKLSQDHLYLILFWAAKRDRSELVWNVLMKLGDVALIRKYNNAFTKQELSSFEAMVERAVLDTDARYVNGKDLNLVPPKNAPTIIDLLTTLTDGDAVLATTSVLWKYKSIGRGRTSENELPKFSTTFEADAPMNKLVFSSTRPNISVSTSVTGVVKVPENDFGLDFVPSSQIRNYTIVRDGIMNIDSLPVKFNRSLCEELEKYPHTVVGEQDDICFWLFDLRNIPVINRGMVENVSKDEFIKLNNDLIQNKLRIRVAGETIKIDGGSTEKMVGMIEKYGEEAAKWLSSIGIRDYGFSPVGTKQTEAVDEYESVEVEVKYKGLSSFPKTNDAKTREKEGKALNIGHQLVLAANAVVSELSSEELISARQLWVKEKREIEKRLSEIVYTLVLGRKWFTDTETLTEDVNFGDGLSTTVTASKVRKMTKI